MVTIKDVAKLAGVAISTASNALNNKYGVNPKTRKKVLEAASQLNFVPNPIAKGLVTSSTRNISMILSGPSSFNVFTNPVFVEVVRTITATLNEKGYHALLNIVSSNEEFDMIPKIVQSRASDALILIGSRQEDEELSKLLKRMNTPSLVVIRGITSADVFAVSVDNRQCGYLATKYLIEMGHYNIGFIGSLPKVSMAEDRLNGYFQALKEAGIDRDNSLVIHGDYYQESGFTGVKQLLSRASHRPTAIFTANDLMALGAMEALQYEGLRVPEDISLIGCDNIPNLHLLRIPLTTIANPVAEIGKLAALKIIGELEGGDELPDKIVLQPELRVRGSVRSIRR
ncbi:transcriptional regulator, LacI family [Seinonella peptonophila]|uniref:Transcriptional regulator, LacI family n=1 Tax=Seinonella peptonophila TaxID=112248 RepID=A0A1M4T3X4_9BACL|nr:LacI family DNA-binding transcriptional regulator [Seinonella peptonophila]SHE39131.1 transcriptional regulator, LacI family [Seinonella peptonophila]